MLGTADSDAARILDVGSRLEGTGGKAAGHIVRARGTAPVRCSPGAPAGGSGGPGRERRCPRAGACLHSWNMSERSGTRSELLRREGQSQAARPLRLPFSTWRPQWSPCSQRYVRIQSRPPHRSTAKARCIEDSSKHGRIRNAQESDTAATFGTVQLISQREAGKGLYEDWARFTLHVDTACEPEMVRVHGGNGGIVSGSRYRLQVWALVSTRVRWRVQRRASIGAAGLHVSRADTGT